MTLPTVLAWSFCRALMVATVALPVALCVQRQAAAIRRPAAYQWFLVCTLLPLIVPDLLIGFTYRLTSLSLIHNKLATETLYAALIFFRVLALQVLVMLVLPGSGVSRHSMHSWILLQHNSRQWWSQWMTLMLTGPLRTPVVSLLAGLLLCFQEFETAALLQNDRHPVVWSVWLFDAHQDGEPLLNSLRYASGSIGVLLALLLPVFLLLRTRKGQPTPHESDFTGVLKTGFSVLFKRPIRNSQPAETDNQAKVSLSATHPGHQDRTAKYCCRMVATAAVAAGMLLLLIWPLCSNVSDGISGLTGFLSQRSLPTRLQQILLSTGSAATAAVASLQAGIWLRKSDNPLLTSCVLLPGLCGSLTLSLVLLAAFQLPFLNAAYDSWLPMLLGQTLWLLPRAYLLVTVLEIVIAQPSVHSASLLLTAADARVRTQARQLRWRLNDLRWLLATAVLTHWCFWDVTIVANLRPVRFEPIVIRLYNEMHFSRTETLVAITTLSLAIPFLLFAIAGTLWNQSGRWRQSQHV